MSMRVWIELISVLLIAVGLMFSPVFGTVENVNVSPSVLVVGHPISFSGVDVETISPNSPPNTILMHVYPGFYCSFSPSNAIAFTTTSVTPSGPYNGSYNTTLTFPATVATSSQAYSGGWAVTSQSYQNGLPAGSYSVSVTDTEAVANGYPSVCKNFTVTNTSPAAEFSNPLIVMYSTLASFMSLLLISRRRQSLSRM